MFALDLSPSVAPAPTGHSFQMGQVMVPVGIPFPFFLSEEHRLVHMAVLGGSGGGKSKFTELLCRYLLLSGEGGLFIDPHGKTANDLMAYVLHCKRRGNNELFDRVHYLEVSPNRCFSLDLFAHAPKRSEVGRVHYDAWMATRVDRIARNMLRRVSEADQQVMKRLKRWLKNVLYACGTELEDGSHFGMNKALVFTSSNRTEFGELFPRVAEYLPDDVLDDFLKLAATPRPQDQEKWVESTINALRDLLSPLVKMIFKPRANSFDMGRVIDRSEFVIVNLKETPNFSHDQKVTIGGLLIDEVLTAKQARDDLPEDQQVPFTMIIDESGEFLGEDLQRAYGATRKTRLSIVMIAQDLSTFATGDLDLARKVLSQAGTVVCFQQTHQEDKEILVDRLGTGNRDFTERVQEVQYQREIEWYLVEEHSEGEVATWNWTKAKTLSELNSVTDTKSLGFTQANTEQETNSRTDVRGRTLGEQTDRLGRKSGTTAGSQESGSIMEGIAKGSQSGSQQMEAQAIQQGTGTAVQDGLGGGGSKSKTTSWKLVPIRRLESEMQPTGNLEAGSLEIQDARMAQQLHLLRMAECVIACRGVPQAFPMKVAFVEEFWVPAAKWGVVQACKLQVTARHCYNFVPSDEIEENHRQFPLFSELKRKMPNGVHRSDKSENGSVADIEPEPPVSDATPFSD